MVDWSLLCLFWLSINTHFVVLFLVFWLKLSTWIHTFSKPINIKIGSGELEVFHKWVVILLKEFIEAWILESFPLILELLLLRGNSLWTFSISVYTGRVRNGLPCILEYVYIGMCIVNNFARVCKSVSLWKKSQECFLPVTKASDSLNSGSLYYNMVHCMCRCHLTLFASSYIRGLGNWHQKADSLATATLWVVNCPSVWLRRLVSSTSNREIFEGLTC